MELNREQIIKALGCYIKKPHISECEKGCIYYEKAFGGYCCGLPLEETLIENALSLIKELTEENEKLSKLLEHCVDDGEYWEGKYNNAVNDTIGFAIIDQVAKETSDDQD